MTPSALASYLQEYSVHLLCIGGSAKGNRFKLESERITLGSGPAASLVLDAPGVEREHAAIEFWGAAFVLREIEPSRPLTLNGEPCRCRELRDGDRFNLGDLTFEFHCEKL
jgi:pSer/pThr/pTyr-binding forkhead associated (FHA) protein